MTRPGGQGSIHGIAIQVRREALQEVIHVAAHEGTAANADLGGGAREQVAGVQRHQVGILLGIHCHAGNDPYPHPQPDIGLDHVGIGGGQHHIGSKPLFAEGVIELGATGKAKHVGDQRMACDGLQGQLLLLSQRMALGHQDAAVPAITGEQYQIVEQPQGFGRDGEVGLTIADHLGDLLGRALLHMQGHIGILTGKLPDHRRQGIARLGMGGGHRQAAATLVAEFLGHLLDVLGKAQYLTGKLHDGLSRRCHSRQMLAAAGKDLDPQLVLEQADLLGDARLRGKQALSGGGDIEIMAGHFPDIAQLLQLHDDSPVPPHPSEAPR